MKPAKPQRINGFPRVAEKIASDPDKTTTIYRRFDRLSARNLLFLEAELAELEAIQDRFDEADLKAANHIINDLHCDWKRFEFYANEKDENHNYIHLDQVQRMELLLKTREKLKEYREMFRFKFC